MFLLIILAIAAITSGMMTMRLIMPYPVSVVYKLLCGAILFLMWCTPFLGMTRGRDWTGVWFNVFNYTAYFLFVYVFLLFVLIMVRDVIWIGSYLVFPDMFKNCSLFNPFNLKTLFYANIVVGVLAFILCGIALYNGVKVPDVKRVEITSDKITSDKTIAVLSDLHLNRTLSLSKLQQIVQKTNALKPDIIILPGDTVDDDIDFIQPHIDILKELKASKGIFISHGNHEFYIGLNQAVQAYRQLGFTELTMTGVSVSPDLFVGGIPDNKSYERFTYQSIDLKQTFQNATDEQYKILLSHNPPFVNRIQSGAIDLQVSGHTHGGQIFPFHILVWLGNGYLAGLYPKAPVPLYITKGAGQWGPQMRLGANSEITLIRLKPTQK